MKITLGTISPIWSHREICPALFGVEIGFVELTLREASVFFQRGVFPFSILTEMVRGCCFSLSLICSFLFRKSEKSASIARDDSFTKTLNASDSLASTKRLASLPPENLVDTPLTASQRRSRFDKNPTNSHDYLPSDDENLSSDLMSTSMIAATANNSSNAGMGSSKNRFFSLSRRFRFRTQSPDKSGPAPASVHFLDEDIDLETKEVTTRKSDHGHRPSKGILKTLRHRSPFRFRSKDAVIVEQEPSPPPPPPVSLPSTPSVSSSTAAAAGGSKEVRAKVLPAATATKTRGRLVELKKPTPKPSTPNGSSRKTANPPASPEPTGSTLLRRASGLKDLIHKFEPTPSSGKPKRVTIEVNTSQFSSTEYNTDDPMRKATSYSDLHLDDQSPRTPALNAVAKSKTIDIPDLLRNVERDPPSASAGVPTRSTLRHSNSSRQTTSFDSTVSMVSASDSINTTNSSTRKPTSTARPLMLSVVSKVIFSVSMSHSFISRAKKNPRITDGKHHFSGNLHFLLFSFRWKWTDRFIRGEKHAHTCKRLIDNNWRNAVVLIPNVNGADCQSLLNKTSCNTRNPLLHGQCRNEFITLRLRRDKKAKTDEWICVQMSSNWALLVREAFSSISGCEKQKYSPRLRNSPDRVYLRTSQCTQCAHVISSVCSRVAW